MAKEDRMKFENAVVQVIEVLGLDTPMTINEVAKRIEVNWKTVDKTISFLISIQDQLTANEIVVLGGANRRIVLLQMRVELSKLPRDVADWFIERRFFSQSEPHIDESSESVSTSPNGPRSPIENAVIRVLETLREEDELSLSSLSKRAGLNRRTVTRALDLLVRIQSNVAGFNVSRTEDGLIIRRALRDLYSLDESRMRYVLSRRYLHEQTEVLSKDQERALLQIA